MSKTNFKFKVGERVRILDGSKIEGYTGGWCMPENVGEEAIIKEQVYYNDRPAYRLKDKWCTWDERGLEPVKNDCIVIYRKGQEVIALDKVTGKKAVAKCSPDDEFDFNIGSKLAFERLLGIEQLRYKEVKRHAKVGECIKIVEPVGSGGLYEKGSILRVNNLGVFGSLYAVNKSGDLAFVDECEYVVLEGYEPPKEEKKETFYNGKVVCTCNEGNEYCLTVGKIYEIKDGIFYDDDGDKRPLYRKDPIKTLDEYHKQTKSRFVEIVE